MILEIKTQNNENIKNIFQRLIGNVLLIETEKVRLEIGGIQNTALISKNFVLSMIEYPENKPTCTKILSVESQLMPNKIGAYFFGLTISEINTMDAIKSGFAFDDECKSVTKVSLFSMKGSEPSTGLYYHHQEMGVSEVVYDVDCLLSFEFSDESQFLFVATESRNEAMISLYAYNNYNKNDSFEDAKKYTDNLHEVFTID